MATVTLLAAPPGPRPRADGVVGMNGALKRVAAGRRASHVLCMVKLLSLKRNPKV
jgi:hypothetical protein